MVCTNNTIDFSYKWIYWHTRMCMHFHYVEFRKIFYISRWQEFDTLFNLVNNMQRHTSFKMDYFQDLNRIWELLSTHHALLRKSCTSRAVSLSPPLCISHVSNWQPQLLRLVTLEEIQLLHLYGCWTMKRKLSLQCRFYSPKTIV